MLMKHRTECRMRALLNHISSYKKGNPPWDAQQFGLLQQFLREAKEQRACDCCGGEHAVNGICRIENGVHKMRKTLRLANDRELLLQLSEDAAAGKRIAVACGSVHDAESLQSFVRHYATGEVGLYTGKTDNSDHFVDLRRHWDPLQVIIYTSTLTTGADYCTPVDRFYIVPHHNTCTPRDMHQMLGRVRELQDTEVWVQASHECREQLHTVTRESLEDRIAQCINQVWHGGKARAAVHRQYVERLRFTVGPHLYEHEYTPAPPDLVVIKGCDDAERSYTTSNHEWMSYFLYMAELKRYSVIYGCSEELDEDDLEAVKEELKFCSMARAQKEQLFFRNLDVSQFRDPVSIQTLEWIGSGKFFKGHEEFFAKWQARFGSGTLNNFKLMARKAHFSIIYPSPEQHNDLKALNQYERSKHAILCCAAVKQEQQGKQSIMTELAVDLLLESRVHDKYGTSTATLAELKRPHPVICIDIGKRLLRALGCTSVCDSAHPVRKSDLETGTVAAVLKEAQSHNLQRGRSGVPTLPWINAVLQSTLCLKLTKPIGEDVMRLCIPKKTGPLLRAHTLLQASWFESKWGLKPPRLDQFKPCSTDTKAKLTAIQGIFKQSQDATSQAFVKQLDAMIQRRGDEGGRAVRDFSFNHVQDLKPQFKIDAEMVAARAAQCFASHNKQKAEDDVLQDEHRIRAERNAAFAARFSSVGHVNKAEREAARQAIDQYLRHRLPEAPLVQVPVSYDIDAATRAEANAAYSLRFREERAALRREQLPPEQQKAARHAIDEYHAKNKPMNPISAEGKRQVEE
jgi:Origin of replication binding protein